MATIFTLVYSSACVKAFEKMIDEFFYAFDINMKVEDVFQYGVFCKPSTYAFYTHYDEMPTDIEKPLGLYNRADGDAVTYIKDVMNQVLQQNIKKPSWMTWVELSDVCDAFGNPPSTFLYIRVKDNRYQQLADSIIKFLYSPNEVTNYTDDDWNLE